MSKVHYRIGSLAWLVIGIYVAISAYRLGLGTFNQPGPGFIFFMASILLVILSVIDLCNTFVGQSKRETQGEETLVWSGLRWQKVLLVFMGMVIYIYLFKFLGFLVSTFLLMIYLFKAVEPTRWWISILSSLITISISYGIFSLWLNVPFPTGILGF
jgi:putative tricarboxylic transport membrane protein